MTKIKVGTKIIINENNHILDGCKGIVIEIDHDTNDFDVFYVEVEGMREWFEEEFLEPLIEKIPFKKGKIFNLNSVSTEIRLEVQEDYLLHEYFVQNYCDLTKLCLK